MLWADQSHSHSRLACVSVLHVNFLQLGRKRPYSLVDNVALHLTVFLLFNCLLDRRRAEPPYRKN